MKSRNVRAVIESEKTADFEGNIFKTFDDTPSHHR